MRALPPLFVFAVFAFLCDRVAAQSIDYMSQERRVRAFHEERFDDGDAEETVSASDEIVANDFNDLDARAWAQAVPQFPQALAEVSQLSSFSTDGIMASGRIHGQTWTLWGGYDWESVVGATFDVVGGPVSYELGYAIDRMEYDEGSRFNDFVLTAVSPEPQTVFDFDVPHEDADGTTSGTVSGVLAPGRYAFRYRDESRGKDIGESLRYEWAFRLTPVPEPGSTAGIVVLAAPVLLRRRRTGR